LYTIQVYFPRKELKIWKLWDYENETSLIEDFLNWFLIVRDKILIGYNILKVDVPLLLIKSQTLPESNDFFLKINKCNIVDLHVILTFLNEGRIRGFKGWCKEFRIPFDPPITGSQINEFITKKRYEEIQKYIEIESRAIGELHSLLFKREVLQKTLKSLKCMHTQKPFLEW